jgi:hypothetical protein
MEELFKHPFRADLIFCQQNVSSPIDLATFIEKVNKEAQDDSLGLPSVLGHSCSISSDLSYHFGGKFAPRAGRCQ